MRCNAAGPGAAVRLVAAVVCVLALTALKPAKAVPLPDPLADTDFYFDGAPSPELVALGERLFFDKILSGNQNIACATCHHPLAGTGDGLSLSVGEGGRGLGVTRDVGGDVAFGGVHERVPRNAPPVFMLGARQMDVIFHDGRVSVDASQPSGFQSPAGPLLPAGLDNVLAVQAMFPVTSGAEMAGHFGDNPVADAAAVGNLPLVWQLLADRLRQIPGYIAAFASAYGVAAEDITYVHAANAIAAFEAVAFRSDDSPFDRYLRGDANALTHQAKKGMQLFYGSAGCSDCHSGVLQTDLDFHAIGMPQVGPGKGVGYLGRDDFGRELTTGDPADRYKFRTPTLRNVALTAPYGHSGAYATLREVVEHHLDPLGSLAAYDCSTQPRLPSRPDLDALDCVVMDDPASVAAIAAASELPAASSGNNGNGNGNNGNGSGNGNGNGKGNNGGTADSVVEPTKTDGDPEPVAAEPVVPEQDPVVPAETNAPQLASTEPVEASAAEGGDTSTAGVTLSPDEVDEILAFLHALTDTRMLDLRHTVPADVPSGLPLQE